MNIVEAFATLLYRLIVVLTLGAIGHQVYRLEKTVVSHGCRCYTHSRCPGPVGPRPSPYCPGVARPVGDGVCVDGQMNKVRAIIGDK